MDHNQIKDQITSTLSDIVERAAMMNEQQSTDILIEVDIAMEDARRLYRLLQQLKQVVQQNHAEQTSPQTEHPGFTADKTPPVVEQTPPLADKTPHVVEQTPPLADKTPPEVEKTPPLADNTPPVVERAAESPSLKKDEEYSSQRQAIDVLPGKANQVVADLFSEDDNSLHSRMSGMKEDRSIGTRMQRKPIANLKEAIGVNEKFLFINELFQGNIQAYNDAIVRLNGMGSSAEAFEYLNELTRIQKWDSGRSSATIEMLANYVQRRFLEK
jgi:hypothetical protein